MCFLKNGIVALFHLTYFVALLVMVGEGRAQSLSYSDQAWRSLKEGRPITIREVRNGERRGGATVAILVKANLNDIWQAVLDIESREEFLSDDYRFVEIVGERSGRGSDLVREVYQVCRFGPNKHYELMTLIEYDRKRLRVDFQIDKAYRAEDYERLRNELDYDDAVDKRGIPRATRLNIPKDVRGGYRFYNGDKVIPDGRVGNNQASEFVLVEYEIRVEAGGLAGVGQRIGDALNLSSHVVASNLDEGRNWLYGSIEARGGKVDWWPRDS